MKLPHIHKAADAILIAPIVDNLEGYLIDLRQAQFKENFADSPKVQFYLEEGDD